MRKLARSAVAGLVLLALLVGARRLFESPAPIPPPGSGERDTQVGAVRWRSREIAAANDATVVFVHGLLASSQSFRKVLGSASAGRTAVAVDLPGFGASDRPASYDYTYGGQAAGLIGFLDARGWKRVALVGNSLGGATAVAVAAAQPNRVAALVLVDAPSSAWAMPWTLRALRAPVVGELAGELACRPLFTLGLRQVLFAEADRADPATVDLYWHPVTTPGTRRAALAAARSSVQGFDRLESAVRAPTLVLWGREDRLIPASVGLELSKRIAGSKLVVLPGAGHVPQEEQPEAFSREVSAFLESALAPKAAETR